MQFSLTSRTASNIKRKSRTLTLLRMAVTIVAISSQLALPSSSQASCAFFAHIPQFSASNKVQQKQQLDGLLATEPRPASDLSICRPAGPTCCTAKTEAEFVFLARTELEGKIRSQLRLIRQFFDRTAEDFRSEFQRALASSASHLHRFFNRTYGRFFVQHRQIFDEFFAELADLFSHQPFHGTSHQNVNFSMASQRLFQRIYIAEFALLNPLRSVDQRAESCMLQLLPSLRPFGPAWETIDNLLGRTFGVWTSLLEAMDSLGQQLDAISQAFALPDFCPAALVRMRHCHLCSPNVLPEQRPCANYCQNVLAGCFSDLARIEPAWELAIDTMLRVSSSLPSVHNPHSTLGPLPVQISEAIMNFQERGQFLSSRILLRCFVDEFQKLLAEEQEQQRDGRWRRRRRRDANAEADLLLSNNGSSSSSESSNSDESSADGNEEDSLELLEDLQFHQRDLKASQGVSRMVDQFRDELLRMRRIWLELPRMLCQEGGFQASPGEPCWNGTHNARYRWRLFAEAGLTRNPEFRATINTQQINNDSSYAQQRLAIHTAAQQLASRNGLRLEQQQQRLEVDVSPDDEDSSVEGSGDVEEADYQEEEQQWHFRQQFIVQAHSNNVGQPKREERHRQRSGSTGQMPSYLTIISILPLLLTFLPIIFPFLPFEGQSH